MQPYELSVWIDTPQYRDQASAASFEEKIYTIGSQFTDPKNPGNMAYNIHFKPNINGTYELTFDMASDYYDAISGEKVHNIFVDEIVGKSRIKLHYKDEWYTFSVKTKEEKRQKGQLIVSYTCIDLMIEELSKNGYALTFTETDGLGTIHELAEKIVKGTTWNYLTEDPYTGEEIHFPEYRSESVIDSNGSLVERRVPIPTYRAKYIDELKKYCYVTPYTFYYDMNGTKYPELKTVYSYLGTKISTSASIQNMVSNSSDFVSANGWNVPASSANGWSAAQLTSGTDGTHYINMMGSEREKAGFGYYDLSGQSFDREKIYVMKWKTRKGNSLKVKIVDASDWSGDNTLTDPFNESSISGLQFTAESNQTYLFSVENSISFYLFFGTDKSTAIQSLEIYEYAIKGDADTKYLLPSLPNGYMKITDTTWLNSILTPEIVTDGTSKATISSVIQVKQYYFVRRYYTEADELTPDYNPSKTSADLVYFLKETELDGLTDWKADEIIKFDVNSSEENLALLDMDYIDVTEDIADTALEGKGLELKADGYKVLFQYDARTANMGSLTEENYLRKEYFEIKSIESPSTVKKVYLIRSTRKLSLDKNKTLKKEKSNRYDILMELCSLFSVFLKFYIEYDEVGQILSKNFYFSEETGDEVGINFSYGVNLDSVTRSIKNENIVTKLWVEDQDNSNVSGGLVSLHNAAANKFGEKFIYNFEYYIRMGLIDQDEFAPELGIRKIDKDGKYVVNEQTDYSSLIARISRINAKIKDYSKQIQELQDTLTTKVTPAVTMYSAEINSANVSQTQNLQTIKKWVQDLKASGSIKRKKEVKNIYAGNFRLGDNAYYFSPWSVLDYSTNSNPEGLIATADRPGYNSESKLFFTIYSNNINRTIDELDGTGTNEKGKNRNPAYVWGAQPISTYLPTEVEERNEWLTKYCNRVDEHNMYLSFEAYTKIYAYNASERESIKDTKIRGIYTKAADYNARTLHTLNTDKNPFISKNNDSCRVLVQDTWNANAKRLRDAYRELAKAQHDQDIINDKIEYLNYFDDSFVEWDGSHPTYVQDDSKTICGESYKDWKDKTYSPIKKGGKVLGYYGLLAYKQQLIEQFERKYCDYIKEGYWTDNSYVDNDKYYYGALSVSATSAMPEVDYSFKVIDLAPLGEFDFYSLSLGDKVGLVDKELFGEKPQEVLIGGMDYVLDNESQNAITVQNYQTRFEDLFKRVSAAVTSVSLKDQTYNNLSKIIDSTGMIKTDLLQTILNKNSSLVANRVNTNVTIDNLGITLTSAESGNNKVLLFSEGIAMTEDGGENYTIGISPKGINAEVINTGSLNANKVNIVLGDSVSYRMDGLGLTAYKTPQSEEGDSGDASAFVRFDKYGVYSIDAVHAKAFVTDDGSRWDEARTDPETFIRNNSWWSLTDASFRMGDKTDFIEFKTGSSSSFSLSTQNIKIGQFEEKKDKTNIYYDLKTDTDYFKSEDGTFSAKFGALKISSGTATFSSSAEEGKDTYTFTIRQAINNNKDTKALEIKKLDKNKSSSINFSVTYGGVLTANEATIKGTIYANKGQIGNWIIKDGAIQSAEDESLPTVSSNYVYKTKAAALKAGKAKKKQIASSFIQMRPNGISMSSLGVTVKKNKKNKWRYVVSKVTRFSMNKDGVSVSGVINASSGQIGSCKIEDDGTFNIDEAVVKIGKKSTTLHDYIESVGNEAKNYASKNDINTLKTIQSKIDSAIGRDGTEVNIGKGTIAGWKITDNALKSSNIGLWRDFGLLTFKDNYFTCLHETLIAVGLIGDGGYTIYVSIVKRYGTVPGDITFIIDKKNKTIKCRGFGKTKWEVCKDSKKANLKSDKISNITDLKTFFKKVDRYLY